MRVLVREVEGFKKVTASARLTPTKVVQVNGRVFTLRTDPGPVGAILRVRAYPPVFDHEGAPCSVCAGSGGPCRSARGLRVATLLTLAAWDLHGRELPPTFDFVSEGLLHYRVGNPTFSNATQLDDGHPHGPGMLFFWTFDEAKNF